MSINNDIVTEISYDELSGYQFWILLKLRRKCKGRTRKYTNLAKYDNGQVDMLETAGLIEKIPTENKTIDQGTIQITVNNSPLYTITTKGILITNQRYNYERYFILPIVISLLSLIISGIALLIKLI